MERRTAMFDKLEACLSTLFRICGTGGWVMLACEWSVNGVHLPVTFSAPTHVILQDSIVYTCVANYLGPLRPQTRPVASHHNSRSFRLLFGAVSRVSRHPGQCTDHLTEKRPSPRWHVPAVAVVVLRNRSRSLGHRLTFAMWFARMFATFLT